MKKLTILWKTALVAVGLFLSLQTTSAQGVFSSAATGNWNASGSWTMISGSDADGIPDADDNVTIGSTHIITVSASTTVECNDLTVAGAAATSLTMAGANSIVNIYSTLAATTAPTVGNYIDCTADVTAKAVFKRNTTGPIISATGWGTFGEKVRIEVNVGSGVEAQVTPTIKFREIIVTSGTLTCAAVVSPDEGAANTGKITIQDGAVFKCVQLKRTSNNVPFHSLIINGTGRLIFTGTSATSTPTVQSGYPIYTFSNDAVIEYQGLTSKIADISYPNLVINVSGAVSTTKTWEPTANNTSKSITVTKGILSMSLNSNTVNSNITVNSTGTITIATGATLNISAGAKVTNNGTITNNGIINYLSDATNGTATIIGDGTINGSGTTKANQYLTTGRNWYIANPMSTAVSPTVASGTITLNKYDEAIVTDAAGATGWAVTTDALAVGKGYVATVSADGNMSFSGTLNNGNINIALTSRAGTTNKAGFNLIGNPYQSYLDWSLVMANPSNAALLRSNTLWYRTKKLNQASEMVYQFQTVNGDGVSVPNDGNAVIPPMQSLWVRAVAGVSDPIVVTNAMRAHAPGSDKLLKAPAINIRTLVRLQVSNSVNTDETVIYQSQNANNDFDTYDAPKMSNGNANIPEIYTTLGSEKIVINSMNSIPMDSPIGLGFDAGNSNSFTLRANEITNIPEGVKVMLRDNVTLTETDLTDGTSSYQFTPETNSGDRFSLIFRTTGTTTEIENAEKGNIQVFVNLAKQITIIAPQNSNYAIYNAVGQVIEKGVINAKYITRNAKCEAGVYVVKVNNQSTRVIIK